MHLRLPAVRRVSLALTVSAFWLAGAPAAGQRSAVVASVPIAMPTLLDTDEAERTLAALFPPAAREAGLTYGSASLKFRVMMDSTVDPASITVERRSNPVFDEPAKAFVARMRFAPATVGGRPMAAWIRRPVFFQDPRVPEEGSYAMSAADRPAVLRNGGDLPRLIAESYPPALRDAGVTGSVLLHFRVDEKGAVEPDRIEVPLTTDPAFEEAAAAVARRLRFRPAWLYNGTVADWVTMPIHFGTVVPGT